MNAIERLEATAKHDSAIYGPAEMADLRTVLALAREVEGLVAEVEVARRALGETVQGGLPEWTPVHGAAWPVGDE